MKNMMRPSKGFTLIELLVVISIIGVLSSVVLASLVTARNRGKFAAIQMEMNQLRTATELYELQNGTYGETFSGICPTTGTTLFATSPLKEIISSIRTKTIPGFDIICHTTGPQAAGEKWAYLYGWTSEDDNESGFQDRCMDSRGWNGKGTVTVTNSVNGGVTTIDVFCVATP